MLRYVYRQLMLDPARTLLTVLALGAVIGVILVLEGFYGGLLVQMRNAVLDRGADLIVTQSGVSNMTASRSILPQYARGEVEAVDGVLTADPLTGISVIYDQDGVRTALFLMVYDRAGGPAHIVEGTAPTSPRDIVVDRSLSPRYGLQIGDPFFISDFEFRISGFSEGSVAFFTPFGFARYDDLIDFYFESDIAADISTFPLLSFLLVRLTPGASPDEVAAAIETAVPDADVFTPEALAAEDESLGRVLFGPIMLLLVGIGYVIGALVTGIIMFATVNARRHEFGVLKALGFSARYLSMSVVIEALVFAILAIPLGILLARLTAAAVEVTAPMYLVSVDELLPMLRTALACLVFAALGALLPVRLIRRLDPSTAFEH